MENTVRYFETVITPHHAGFGMWQAGETSGEGWADETDLLNEAASCGPLYELGVNEPEGSDIRGNIYGTVGRVFCFHDEDGEIRYFGIVERWSNNKA